MAREKPISLSARYLPLLCAALLGAGRVALCAQAAADTAAAADLPASNTAAAPSGAPALAREFHQLALGMDLASLKTALANDNEFVFRGDADVSFLPLRKQNVVDTAGRGFIKRAFFQLDETGAATEAEKTGAVFIMAFVLNSQKMDHYSIFTRLVEKYGEPRMLNPKMALWEDDSTRIYLERPLTVKYVDKVVFDRLVEASRVLESSNAQLRADFLDNF